VNQGHMEFCTSAAWQDLLVDQILPGALGLADLGPTVVEVGPGPGFTTELLCRTADHVTAVEIDADLVDQLRARADGSKVTIVLGDARATGLEAASFTGAASFHMLHHVPTHADQDEVFAELFRLLEPGGTLVLADGFDSECVRQFHEGDIYNPIDPDTLAGRLEPMGFAGVRTATHDLGWYCTSSKP
jgi:SAM-dependent methyltransferase